MEFYFRFRSGPSQCNLHVILHQATEFDPNLNFHCGNLTSFRFSRWRPRPRNTTSGFVFVDVTAFRRSKSISKSNFVDVSHFAAKIYLLPFWKRNVRHIGILLPVSISVTPPQSTCYFATGCKFSSKSDNLQRKYDVISIFQDGGRGGSILLPVSYLFMPLPSES